MPTSWKSKLQAEVAQSNLEAKYRAMNKASRKVNWYRNILGEIGFPCEKPSTLYFVIIRIVWQKNLVLHARTKYLEGNCHYSKTRSRNTKLT